MAELIFEVHETACIGYTHSFGGLPIEHCEVFTDDLHSELRGVSAALVLLHDMPHKSCRI